MLSANFARVDYQRVDSMIKMDRNLSFFSNLLTAAKPTSKEKRMSLCVTSNPFSPYITGPLYVFSIQEGIVAQKCQTCMGQNTPCTLLFTPKSYKRFILLWKWVLTQTILGERAVSDKTVSPLCSKFCCITWLQLSKDWILRVLPNPVFMHNQDVLSFFTTVFLKGICVPWL